MRRIPFLCLAFLLSWAAIAHAEPVRVDFVLWDADARSIDLVGNFNGWAKGRNQLQHADGDTWIGTVWMEPGRYEYKYVLDGSRYIADPRNSRVDARSGNSVIHIEAGADPGRNFNRRLVRHEFRFPAGSGSAAFVTGEFSRWVGDLYPLHRDAASNSWVGVHYLPPGPSDISLVVDGDWRSANPQGDGRRFFFNVEDPDRFRIAQGYLRGPFEVDGDRMTLRGRLMPPASTPAATRTGFEVEAYLNNEPLPVLFDEATGFITLEATGLKQGLNTVAVYARRGVERAEPALYHVVRSAAAGAVTPVILVSGDLFTGEPVTIDGRQSYASGSSVAAWRWSVDNRNAVIADPRSATTTLQVERPGALRLTLKVMDMEGRSAEATSTVNIQAPPANLHHVTFRLNERDLTSGGSPGSVAVAGSFNSWSKDAFPLTRQSNGSWEGKMWLSAGEHEYKFVVNGADWIADPRNSQTRGAYGNSRLQLGAAAGAPVEAEVPPGLSKHVRDAVIYQVMVPRYCDSDGDGIGDLKGLTSRLDVIRDLGANWIYLLPIFESPNQHGYTTTDYFTIDRELGSIADFREFLAAAHARGLRVMLDYVFYHSAADHPILLLAAQNPASTWRSWHRWTGPTTWTGFGGENSSLPGWNFGNAAVRRYAIDAALYWQSLGVDGFRCDVAHSVPDDFWAEWAAALKARDPEVLLFPEFNEPNFDLYYDFSVTAVYDVFKGQPVDKLNGILSRSEGQGRFPVRFLDYHDKDRALTLLGGDVAKNRLAAVLLMTAPGVPLIYYGEEVGMEGWMDKNTNRELMEWDYPDSLLRDHYRTLIRLRKSSPALQVGSIRRILVTNEERVYATMRQEGDERLVVVLNFSDRSVAPQLNCSLIRPAFRSVSSIFGRATAAISGTTMTVRLPPYEGAVFRLE